MRRLEDEETPEKKPMPKRSKSKRKPRCKPRPKALKAIDQLIPSFDTDGWQGFLAFMGSANIQILIGNVAAYEAMLMRLRKFLRENPGAMKAFLDLDPQPQPQPEKETEPSDEKKLRTAQAYG